MVPNICRSDHFCLDGWKLRLSWIFVWMCKGGFSIINQDGGCIHNGTVQHPALSSYSTELWALTYVFLFTPKSRMGVIWLWFNCEPNQSTHQFIEVPHTTGNILNGGASCSPFVNNAWVSQTIPWLSDGYPHICLKPHQSTRFLMLSLV